MLLCRVYINIWTNKVLDKYFYVGPNFLHHHALEMTLAFFVVGLPIRSS